MAVNLLAQAIARLRDKPELKSQSIKKLTRGPVASNPLGMSYETAKRLVNESEELQQLLKPDDPQTAWKRTIAARGTDAATKLADHPRWADLPDDELARKLGITPRALTESWVYGPVRTALAAIRGVTSPVGRWPNADRRVAEAREDLQKNRVVAHMTEKQRANRYGVDPRTLASKRWEPYRLDLERIAQEEAAEAAQSGRITFDQAVKELGCSKKHLWECIRNGLYSEKWLVPNGRRPRLKRFVRRAEIMAIKAPPSGPPRDLLIDGRGKCRLRSEACVLHRVPEAVILLWMEKGCVWIGRKLRVHRERDPHVGAGVRRYVFDDDIEAALAIRAYCLEHGWTDPRGRSGWNPSKPPTALIAAAQAKRTGKPEHATNGHATPAPPAKRKRGRPKGSFDSFRRRNDEWLAAWEREPRQWSSKAAMARDLRIERTTLVMGIAEAEKRRAEASK